MSLPPLPLVPHGFQTDTVRARYEQRLRERAAFVDDLIARGADGLYIVRALDLRVPWSLATLTEPVLP